MAMNSVNTNMSSMLALQSLNRTSDQLSVVQKRVSTGFRVADSKDDGGAFAVAQAVRADVAGLAAANEQLGGTKGILETTFAALGKVSETMVKVRETLTRLADGTLNDEQRSQYETQYSALKTQIENFITDATYNGIQEAITKGITLQPWHFAIAMKTCNKARCFGMFAVFYLHLSPQLRSLRAIAVI